MKPNYIIIRQILDTIVNDIDLKTLDFNPETLYNLALLEERGYVRDYTLVGIQLSWEGHELFQMLLKCPDDMLKDVYLFGED
jgi:hypothetical protein